MNHNQATKFVEELIDLINYKIAENEDRDEESIGYYSEIEATKKELVTILEDKARHI